MHGSLLHDIQVEARTRDKKERGQRLFGLSLFSVSPYARVVPSTVNSWQVRLTCRDDEGCAPLPDQSLPQCKNPPMVHPVLRIGETAFGARASPDLGTSSCLWCHTRTGRRVWVSHHQV